MKFFCQALVIKIWIFFKVEFDAITRFDVFEFFDLKFVQVLQTVLFIFFNDCGNLWMIYEGRQPKLWNAFYDIIAFVVERPPKFVVLLFDFKNFFASLCKYESI